MLKQSVAVGSDLPYSMKRILWDVLHKYYLALALVYEHSSRGPTVQSRSAGLLFRKPILQRELLQGLQSSWSLLVMLAFASI